jgi:glutathione reductase (NADPH)
LLKRAAKYGVNVGLIEHNKLGGTCVNTGCIPKKITFNAANLFEEIKLIRSYGIN